LVWNSAGLILALLLLAPLKLESRTSVQTSIPNLISLSPTAAIQGATLKVLLTGANFIPSETGIVSDEGGIVVQSVTMISPTTLEATIVVVRPPGSVSLRVITPAGSSNIVPFQIMPSPLSGAAPLEVTHFAGSFGGTGWKDGFGADARFRNIRGVWTDGTDLFLTDDHAVRRVNLATGEVSTFAGDSRTPGFTDATGRGARFRNAAGIWGDAAYLYVADSGNHAIRRIERSTAVVTTIAQVDRAPGSIHGDGVNLYFSDTSPATYRIRRFQTLTAVTQTIAEFTQPNTGIFAGPPVGLWTDGLNLFFADVSRLQLRKVYLPTGLITDVAYFAGGVRGDGPPRNIWSDGTRLYVSCGKGVRVIDPSVNGILSESFPLLTNTSGPLTGSGGYLFVGSVQVEIGSGKSRIVAGAGSNESGWVDGIGATALFKEPKGLWGDGKSLYVVDNETKLRSVSLATAEVVTLPGLEVQYGASSFWGDGQHLYSVGSGIIKRLSLSTGRSEILVDSGFSNPSGVWGNESALFVAQGRTIRRVDKRNGTVSVLAGGAESGNIDGIGQAARFADLISIWGDGKHLYVGDSTPNNSIRKINIATGEVSTLAGGLSGSIDGVGGNAGFAYPWGIWGDGTYLYVVEIYGNDLRRVTIATGEVVTLAGSGIFNSETVRGAQDGVGSDAEFSNPQGIWGDGTNLYIADTDNNTIRKLGVPGSVDPPSTFLLADRGGTTLTTGMGFGNFITGSASLEPTAGSAPPDGLSVIKLRQNNVLVSEIAIPASRTIRSARLYVQASNTINTGVAIANPNDLPVTIDGYFTDSSGRDSGNWNLTIPAHGQVARFSTEPPFSSSLNFNGTLTFNASLPVAAVALRGFANERSEFLMTSLPIVDLAATTGAAQVLPHFADGGGWRTRVILINPTDQSISGTVMFVTDLPDSFSYSIPPRSSYEVEPSGNSPAIRTGFIRVIPVSGSTAPSAAGIYTFGDRGVTVTSAGVSAVRTSGSFRLYSESTGSFGAKGSVETGLAVANNGSGPATIDFELTNLSGATAGTGRISLPAGRHTAMFLSQIPTLLDATSPFQGVLRVSSNVGADLSVLGLRGRYNERGEFLISEMPAFDESGPSPSSLVFPHFADGQGYSTEFILINAVAGLTSGGQLRFFSPTGQSLLIRNPFR